MQESCRRRRRRSAPDRYNHKRKERERMIEEERMNEEIIQDRRSRSRDDNIDGASSSTKERNIPIVPVSCNKISH